MSLYVAHLANVVSIYVILAASLNLLAGYGGMVAASHVAIFGLGSYALAFLTVVLHWPFAISIVLSVALAGFVSFAIGALCTRFSEDFFLLATLAVHLGLQTVFANWVSVTGGPYGLGGIPSPTIFGWSALGGVAKAVVTAVCAVASLLLLALVLRSPFTRCLQAVRDDSVAAAGLGLDSLRLRKQAFTVAGVLAGFAGALYASTIGYIDPQAFALDEVVLLIAIVVVGGAGDMRGPLVGTLVVFLIPELLRFLPLPAGVAANLRQVLFGLLLLIAMRYRPNGLMGRYAFD